MANGGFSHLSFMFCLLMHLVILAYSLDLLRSSQIPSKENKGDGKKTYYCGNDYHITSQNANHSVFYLPFVFMHTQVDELFVCFEGKSH